MGVWNSLPSKVCEYSEQENVKEINKISLGRLIVKYVGNEGTKGTFESAALRELLQHAISSLETQTKEVWANAELLIYDKEGRIVCVRSGNAAHKFLLLHDGINKPQLKKVKKHY